MDFFEVVDNLIHVFEQMHDRNSYRGYPVVEAGSDASGYGCYVTVGQVQMFFKHDEITLPVEQLLAHKIAQREWRIKVKAEEEAAKEAAYQQWLDMFNRDMERIPKACAFLKTDKGKAVLASLPRDCSQAEQVIALVDALVEHGMW